MSAVSRLLALLVVLGFLAGTTAAHAAAAAMAGEMAMPMAAGDAMPDCDGCGDGDTEPRCSAACAVPVWAMPVADAPLLTVAAAPRQALPVGSLHSYLSGPDPSPPRPAHIA